jgi:hypothetical protein
MIVPLVLTAILFWGAIFLVFFSAEGTSPLDFLLGAYEPLPDDLGEWRKLGPDEPSGLLREERWLLPGTDARASSLVRQVRFRHPETGTIVEVAPETLVPRGRRRGA